MGAGEAGPLLQSAQQRLREELDYHHEAANIVAMQRQFRGDPDIVISFAPDGVTLPAMLETWTEIGDINFFSPEQPLIADGLIVDGVDEVRKAVREEIKYGGDWIKLLVAEDIPPEVLREKDGGKAIPPLYGALLKNEQDVHLLERLAFMHRRESR